MSKKLPLEKIYPKELIQMMGGIKSMANLGNIDFFGVDLANEISNQPEKKKPGRKKRKQSSSEEDEQSQAEQKYADDAQSFSNVSEIDEDDDNVSRISNIKNQIKQEDIITNKKQQSLTKLQNPFSAINNSFAKLNQPDDSEDYEMDDQQDRDEDDDDEEDEDEDEDDDDDDEEEEDDKNNKEKIKQTQKNKKVGFNLKKEDNKLSDSDSYQKRQHSDSDEQTSQSDSKDSEIDEELDENDDDDDENEEDKNKLFLRPLYAFKKKQNLLLYKLSDLFYPRTKKAYERYKKFMRKYDDDGGPPLNQIDIEHREPAIQSFFKEYDKNYEQFRKKINEDDQYTKKIENQKNVQAEPKKIEQNDINKQDIPTNKYLKYIKDNSDLIKIKSQITSKINSSEWFEFLKRDLQYKIKDSKYYNIQERENNFDEQSNLGDSYDNSSKIASDKNGKDNLYLSTKDEPLSLNQDNLNAQIKLNKSKSKNNQNIFKEEDDLLGTISEEEEEIFNDNKNNSNNNDIFYSDKNSVNEDDQLNPPKFNTKFEISKSQSEKSESQYQDDKQSMSIEEENTKSKPKQQTNSKWQYENKIISKFNMNQIKKSQIWGEPINEYGYQNYTIDNYGKIFDYKSMEIEKNENENDTIPFYSTFSKNEFSVVAEQQLYKNEDILNCEWVNPSKTDLKDKIMLDLNDSKVFFEGIHQKFVISRSSLQKLNQFANMLQMAGATEQQKQIKDLSAIIRMNNEGGEELDNQPKIDFENVQQQLRASKNLYMSDSDSLSQSSKQPITNLQKQLSKAQKEKKKEFKLKMIQQGIDPILIEKIWEQYQKQPKNKEEKEGNANDITDMLLKISRRQHTTIEHSNIANSFLFNNFKVYQEDYENFHRPDFLYKLLIQTDYKNTWKIELVNKQASEALIQQLKRKRDMAFGNEDLNNNEIVESYEIFKSKKRLSLKSDPFVLLEYVEENPLIIQNVGMASRLNRNVYMSRLQNRVREKEQKDQKNEQEDESGKKTTEREELAKFKDEITKTLGQHGSIKFLKNDEKLPLIGQITNEKYLGVCSLENNMFYAPVFIQKPPKTDFVLVRYRDEENKLKFYLRKLEYIYTVGQIEPKVEVFSPHSRSLNAFIRKCLKLVIKQSFESGQKVYLKDLQEMFPTVNDHILRKNIKELGGEQDTFDNKVFHYTGEPLPDEDEDATYLRSQEFDVTPEDLCLFERMHACLHRLKQLGIEQRNADKINTAKNKYIKKYSPNPKSSAIAKVIAEELQLTSWNLSQSYMNAKQTQGRMYLTGLGDPTNGHGGYSYIKLPLKISRYAKEEKFQKFEEEDEEDDGTQDKSEKGEEEIKKQGNMVGGTDADLRKLQMSKVSNLLREHGIKEETLKSLQRWEKIALLREVSNKKTENDQLMQFSRKARMTTKMQKETYQKEINRLFMMLVDNLAITDPNKIDISKISNWEKEGLEYTLDEYMAKEQKVVTTTVLSGGLASLNNAKTQQ